MDFKRRFNKTDRFVVKVYWNDIDKGIRVDVFNNFTDVVCFVLKLQRFLHEFSYIEIMDSAPF